MAQRPRILLSRRRWVNRSVALAHPAAGLAMLAVFSVLIFRTYHLVYAPAAPSPLYGIWSVDEFRAAGNPGGPLLTPRVASALSIHPGEDRWRELIIDAPRRAAIRLGNGKLDSISVAVDPGGKIATFTDPGDTEWKCDFRMERPDRDSLHLDGRINGIESSVQLHRVSPETLRLTGDRFHWVR